MVGVGGREGAKQERCDGGCGLSGKWRAWSGFGRLRLGVHSRHLPPFLKIPCFAVLHRRFPLSWFGSAHKYPAILFRCIVMLRFD